MPTLTAMFPYVYAYLLYRVSDHSLDGTLTRHDLHLTYNFKVVFEYLTVASPTI